MILYNIIHEESKGYVFGNFCSGYIFCEQYSLRVIKCNEVVIKNGSIHQVNPTEVVCCNGLTQTGHQVPSKANLSLP